MLQIDGFKRHHTLPLTLVLIIGMITGWLGFILFGDFASNTKVVYVSAKEILKLDKDRIESFRKSSSNRNDNNNKSNRYNKDQERGEEYQEQRYSDSEAQHIFYGYPDFALKIMDRMTQHLGNKNTKVIFLNDTTVKGDMVSSASKQVHSKILRVIRNRIEKDSREEIDHIDPNSLERTEVKNINSDGLESFR